LRGDALQDVRQVCCLCAHATAVELARIPVRPDLSNPHLARREGIRTMDEMKMSERFLREAAAEGVEPIAIGGLVGEDDFAKWRDSFFNSDAAVRGHGVGGPSYSFIAHSGWSAAIEAVRSSLQSRLEGREEGGDVEIMRLVDEIVKKEGTRPAHIFSRADDDAHMDAQGGMGSYDPPQPVAAEAKCGCVGDYAPCELCRSEPQEATPCKHDGGFRYEDPGPLSDDIIYKVCNLCGKDVLGEDLPPAD
jgi:hypothetical protein